METSESQPMVPRGDSTDPWEISMCDAKALLHGQSPPLLLDCRTDEEYDASHLAGAMLIALQQVSVRLEELLPHKDQQIIVYCRTGRRSRIVARYLSTCGFQHAWSMAGGIDGWNGPVKTTGVS
jgi:rhodanese-related sulfurtransferase